MLRIVGIGEMYVSNQKSDVVVTYSLGSCVGITIYDPQARVGGIIHCMLPLSSLDPVKAENKPCMFADTGMNAFLGELFSLGARRCNMVVKVAGCASLLDENKFFNIGERNYKVAKKILEKNNLRVSAENVFGTVSRTIYLHMDSGQTTLKAGGKEVVLA